MGLESAIYDSGGRVRGCDRRNTHTDDLTGTKVVNCKAQLP